MNVLATPSFIACLAVLTACSGTNNKSFFKTEKTSSSNITVSTPNGRVSTNEKQSNSNISINTPAVKVNTKDKPNKVKIFGVNVEESKKTDNQDVPYENPRFLNGEECKYCDYISRTENDKGHLVEAEIAGNFKNGEEREYLKGEIIRSSYYVDGAKSGMEYYYLHGIKNDSAYIETTSGGQWDSDKIKQKLPSPISIYIYDLLFKDPDGKYTITTTNGMISTIYKKKTSDSIGISIAATIDYKRHSNFSDFKVNIRLPFPEGLVYKNNELVERKKIKGGKTVFEFKKDSIVKELFPNGKTSLYATGNVNYLLNTAMVSCSGDCHILSFFENGIKKEEEYYSGGKTTKAINRNEKNVVTFDYNYPTYFKLFYDDGSLQKEFQGDFSFNGEIVINNGHLKSYFPNGKPELDITYENGNSIKTTEWYENGNVKTETDHLSYERKYFENGQMSFELQGTLKNVNGDFKLTEGTQKTWQTDGLLRNEIITKDGAITSLKSWDSTGFLEVDYESQKHIKTYTNTDPSQRFEWIGNVVYENEDYLCKGTCEKKKYLGKVLIYKETQEGFNPSTQDFQKVSITKYDSTGKKIFQKAYVSGELVNWKQYFPGKEEPSVDFNRDTHLKYFSEPKVLTIEFKGKSKLDKHVTYIEGTEIRYYNGKKKKSETKWKDSKVVSQKSWDENGSLTQTQKSTNGETSNP